MTSPFALFRRRRPYLSDLMENDVSVGLARPADRRDLDRLAQLDSSDTLTGPVVWARVDGELRAAVSLDDGRAIANPFVPTVDLVDAVRRLAWRS
jgi:hypothetical protein